MVSKGVMVRGGLVLEVRCIKFSKIKINVLIQNWQRLITLDGLED